MVYFDYLKFPVSTIVRITEAFKPTYASNPESVFQRILFALLNDSFDHVWPVNKSLSVLTGVRWSMEPEYLDAYYALVNQPQKPPETSIKSAVDLIPGPSFRLQRFSSRREHPSKSLLSHRLWSLPCSKRAAAPRSLYSSSCLLLLTSASWNRPYKVFIGWWNPWWIPSTAPNICGRTGQVCFLTKFELNSQIS